MKALPVISGAAGMVFVGGSVAVSGHLAGAPLFTVQALRYGAAFLLLLAWARFTGARLHRPRGTEWLWLLGVTGTGLLLFNVALVRGAAHAEPAVLGVAVACVPILLAVGGPMLEGRSPSQRVILAAVVVTAGAALVQGLGRTDAAGLAWAFVTFACEAAFTLLAVPLLGRHGPLGVSAHTTWLAAVLFGVAGAVTEGPAAVARLTAADLLAGAYLAVAVTALAFLLWYTCVDRIGAGRAGLLTGVAPISAALAGMALGGPSPRPLVWLGIATVAVGLGVGLTGRGPASPERAPGRCRPGVPRRLEARAWRRSEGVGPESRGRGDDHPPRAGTTKAGLPSASIL
ncbi:DMT family transporter [Actinoplanes sp. NPDC023714]|uniref:DMT family transporter n=1 Tax=Actinoplanes sp. NPDC023714 TaxID=3154322 RepID=UPI0033E8D7B5